MMENIAILIVVGLICGLAVAYIYREKKRGAKCIGCPHSKTCHSGSCADSCRCGKHAGCGEH